MLGDRRLSSVVGVSHQQRSRARLMGDLGPRVARGPVPVAHACPTKKVGDAPLGRLVGPGASSRMKRPALQWVLGVQGLVRARPALRSLHAAARAWEARGSLSTITRRTAHPKRPQQPAEPFQGLTAPPPQPVRGQAVAGGAAWRRRRCGSAPRPAPWWLPA